MVLHFPSKGKARGVRKRGRRRERRRYLKERKLQGSVGITVFSPLLAHSFPQDSLGKGGGGGAIEAGKGTQGLSGKEKTVYSARSVN